MYKNHSNKAESEFLLWIAYLQIISIFLVVVGHSLHSHPFFSELWLNRALFSFRMPTFMFASGYLLVYTNRHRPYCLSSMKRFISTKLKRLLFPTLAISALIWFPRCLMSQFADDVVTPSVESFVKGLFSTNELVIPYYWFTLSAFNLLIFTYVFVLVCKQLRLRPSVALTVETLLLALCHLFEFSLTDWMAINKTLELGVYFSLGALSASIGLLEKKTRGRHIFQAFVLSAVLWGILFYFTQGAGWSMIIALAGIIMCVALSKLLGMKRRKFMEWWIGSSYTIFLLSWFCNVSAQQVLHHFVEMHWGWHTLLSIVSAMTIPVLIYKWACSEPQSVFKRKISLLLGISSVKKGTNRLTTPRLSFATPKK